MKKNEQGLTIRALKSNLKLFQDCLLIKYIPHILSKKMGKKKTKKQKKIVLKIKYHILNLIQIH